MEIGFWENKNHNLPLVYSITDQQEIKRVYNELVTSNPTISISDQLWEHLKETDKIHQWIEYD